MSSERRRRPTSRVGRASSRRRPRRGARRTSRPSGRSRHRPTGTRLADSRARGRASAHRRRAIACGAWCDTQQREAAVLRDGEDAVGLHRHAGEALAHHGDLGDRRRRPRPDRSRRPRGTLCRSRCSSRAPGTAAGASGASAVGGGHHGGQRVVVDDDRLGCVVGLRAGSRPPRRRRCRRRSAPARRRRPAGSAVSGIIGKPCKARQTEVVAARVVHGDHTRHRRRRADVDR